MWVWWGRQGGIGEEEVCVLNEEKEEDTKKNAMKERPGHEKDECWEDRSSGGTLGWRRAPERLEGQWPCLPMIYYTNKTRGKDPSHRVQQKSALIAKAEQITRGKL